MAQEIIMIDGFSLLYRAFYALPLMDNGEGEYTNALFGFMSMLIKVLDERKPAGCLVAFDISSDTFRKRMYADYKGGRPPLPQEMRPQIDLLKEMLAEMNIPSVGLEGYEADDVLGTLSERCESMGVDALIVTGDRDSYQLAGKHTSILYTKRGISETETVDTSWIKEKYNLEPKQLIDVKSLMGDTSDKIPGVAGIGEKTAVKLINEFGSLENLLNNLESLKGAVKEKLLAGTESAMQSYVLAKIVRDIPIEFDFESCKSVNPRGALPLLRRLKLRSIISRINESAAAKTDEAKENSKPENTAISVFETGGAEGLELIRRTLKDLEGTAALHIGAAISLATSTGTYISCALGGDLLTPGITDEEIYDAVRMGSKARLVFYNIKALPFDIEIFKGRSDDAMLAAYVLNPQAANKTPEDVCALTGTEFNAQCPAASLLKAMDALNERLKQTGLDRLYTGLELPLLYVLREMENAGFKADGEYLARLGVLYQKRIAEISAEIYKKAGCEVNLNSPKQLKKLLFEDMGIPVPSKSKAGTGADILEELSEAYPICADILEYRKYQKLNSTYVTGLVKEMGADGRIHTCFEQAVTGTGRISSREPNLQNIPVRTELGREIRRAFLPSEGCVLVDADYSQIELRVLAHMSGDENMQDAFKKGQDIHTRTASEVFSVPIESVTREMRSAAKAVNFGIVYVISEFGL